MTTTINGKPAGFLFGYTSYKRFMTALMKNKALFLSENDEEKLTDEAYVEILHTGYESWCADKRITAELSRDDLSRWADQQYTTEDGKKFVNSLFDEWAQSRDVKELIEANEKKNQDSNSLTLTPSKDVSLESSDTNLGNSTGSRGETPAQQLTG